MKRRLRILLPILFLLILTIVGISATTTAQVNVSGGINYGSNWTALYFNNTNLSSSPVNSLINISQVNFNYGANSPFNLVNADNFSIRFTTTENFAQGEYRFTAQANDGVRVIIDGTTIIDQFTQAPSDGLRLFTQNAAIAAGTRNITVEFVEFTGTATIQFFWEPISVVP